MLTLTLPSSKILGIIIPASVFTRNSSFVTSPLSLTYLAKHLIPFPHIWAVEPSELKKNQPMSASSTFVLGIIRPSAPIPKCLSQSFLAVSDIDRLSFTNSS